jgi:hypothetical protein
MAAGVAAAPEVDVVVVVDPLPLLLLEGDSVGAGVTTAQPERVYSPFAVQTDATAVPVYPVAHSTVTEKSGPLSSVSVVV